MNVDELIARESIRDLVARYNANGDSARYDDVVDLFWEDAVMEIEPSGIVYNGHAEITTMFTGAGNRFQSTGTDAVDDAGNAVTDYYIRHRVATHVIDLLDPTHARGYSYFAVIMPHGLDHWGRYFDRYEARDGVWKFARRRVASEGHRSVPSKS